MTTILLTAVITAAITLFVVALWGHFHLQPRLQRALKRELDEEARKAADLIAASVEEAVKRGINGVMVISGVWKQAEGVAYPVG